MANRAILMLLLTRVAEGAQPFPPSPIHRWDWVGIEGNVCIDGKATGVWIRRGKGKGLGIWMDGGGACFNLETCLAVSTESHPSQPGTCGLFADDERNPLKDFSWVHVPYCSGDVHIGQTKKIVSGHERIFNGRANLQRIVEKAAATWDPDTLLIGGASAGGFGATANFVFLSSYFPQARTVLVDDSGPIIDDKALAPCLQEKWRKTWNLTASLPPKCGCSGTKGNLVSIWDYIRENNRNSSIGLISSLKDETISTFFSYGDLDCANSILPIGYTKLQAGLERLSARGVPIYMIEGNTHVHTAGSNEFYTRIVSGIHLYKWVAALVDPNTPDPGTVKPQQQVTSLKE